MPAARVDVLHPLARHRQRPTGRGPSRMSSVKPMIAFKRRAQLVAHAGQEVALRLARAAQGLDRLREADRQLLLLGQHGPPLHERGDVARQDREQSGVVGPEEPRVGRQEHERRGSARSGRDGDGWSRSASRSGREDPPGWRRRPPRLPLPASCRAGRPPRARGRLPRPPRCGSHRARRRGRRRPSHPGPARRRSGAPTGPPRIRWPRRRRGAP